MIKIDLDNDKQVDYICDYFKNETLENKIEEKDKEIENMRRKWYDDSEEYLLEIERLNNIIKEKDKEIERLNNIINKAIEDKKIEKLERFIPQKESDTYCTKYNEVADKINEIIDKINAGVDKE